MNAIFFGVYYFKGGDHIIKHHAYLQIWILANQVSSLILKRLYCYTKNEQEYIKSYKSR